jgi:hypothetical protein
MISCSPKIANPIVQSVTINMVNLLRLNIMNHLPSSI